MANKKEMLKAAKKSAAAIAAGTTEEKKVKAAKTETKQPEKKQESGETKGVSFRLPVETIEKLKDLCMLTGRTATGWITTAIEDAHELRAADIETIQQLQRK